MAIRFDAVGDTARNTSGGYVDATGAYTVTFWVYSVSASAFHTMVTIGSGASYHVAVMASGAWGVASNSGGLSTGGTVTNSTWYQCEFRYNGTNTITLTVNGSVVASVAAADLTSTALIEFGNDLNISGAEYLNGRLVNAKVFASNLTAPQAAAELATYNEVLSALAIYQFKTATDVNDYTTNGRNLTAGGTLTTEAGPPIVATEIPIAISGLLRSRMASHLAR